MIPTPEIQYVIRTIKNPIQRDAFLVAINSNGEPIYEQQETIDIQVLQQKWVQNDLEAMCEPRRPKFEWRDVPILKEDSDGSTTKLKEHHE
jgi:hypothetical protein